MANSGEILRAVGDFGLFQTLIVLALSFPIILLSVSFASILFIDSDPERHCNTDWILGAGPNLTEEEQLNLTVPREPDGSLSRCLMYAPVNWTLDSIRQYGLNHTTACWDGWVYDQTLYQATSFDLVCNKAHLAGIAQTVFMAVILAGSFIFGPASEPFGRKTLVQIPVFLLMVFTVVSGLSLNLYMYLASQFMVGISIGGYRITASVLGKEWLGISKRSLFPCMNQLLTSIGQCGTAGLMFGVRDWRMALCLIRTRGRGVYLHMFLWQIQRFSTNLGHFSLSLNAGNFGLNILLLQSRSVVIAVLATVGRFLFTCSSSVSMVYGQELSPTSVSLTLVGGSLAFLLPETQGRELADSTAQAEVQR
ncbi:unnamed protein product [Arctogadus glacialis]